MWLIASAVALATFLPSAMQPRVVEMEACRVRLTPSGQAALFQATVICEASTDGDGSVAALKPLMTYDFFKAFVEVDRFESCVRRWKFSGGGKTMVTLFAGTSAEAPGDWRISVSSGGKTLRLVLT